MEERLVAARAAGREGAGGTLLGTVEGGIATVTLNRPAALNALTLPMIETLDTWLGEWERDDAVRIVVLRGAGGKAFCAGGDIKTLREDFVAGGRLHERFFTVEYALDCRIHRYPKPVVALMDGIVMGGGMGISQGAALRLAGPRTRLAMPETAIGLFPDVGGTWFLSRAPGALGQYLGLAGPSLGAADSLAARLVDACLPEGAEESLAAVLAEAAASDDPRAVLARFAAGLPPPAGGDLARLRPAIDRHFSLRGVPAIVASLQAESDPAFAPWAKDTVALLAKRSPTLLCVAHEQIRRGATLSLEECFRLELGLVQACFEQGDFIEGIRALIVDKDNTPRWNPPCLAQVEPARVEAFFAPRWRPEEHPLARL